VQNLSPSARRVLQAPGILPTEYGVRSVLITDLMPLAAVWTVDGGTQPYDPSLFTDQ
jgi:cytidine deaminase